MRKFFMKANQFHTSYLLLGAIFLLSGCASYKAEPLNDFTEDNTSYSDKDVNKN